MANEIKWQTLSIKSTSHANLTLDFDAELGKWKLMDAGRLVARRKNIRSLMESAGTLLQESASNVAAKAAKTKPAEEPAVAARDKKAGKKTAKKAAKKTKKPKAVATAPAADGIGEGGGVEE